MMCFWGGFAVCWALFWAVALWLGMVLDPALVGGSFYGNC